MVDTKRSVAELLNIFADGQPQGSIDPQDMRDLVVSTVHDSIRIIRQESDFPTPILAPDGVMRIPLDITTSYVFDLGEINIATPFLLPERLLGLERVRMQSFTNTTFNYTGTDTLFWGRNTGALESDKVDWVAITPGTQCFDMVAGFGLVSITIFNTAFLDWDMGFLSGFALFGRRFGMVRPRGAFRLHDLTRCFVDNLRFVTPPAPNANPNFILTGGDNLANPKFENTLVQPMLAGQSFFSIDSGSTYKQTGFENIPYDGTESFFQLDLTGSLSSMADLSLLITGDPTEYKLYDNDGTNFTVVTDVGHSVYVGLVVDHSGTTNYDGQHIVTRVLGNDQYVMDVLHLGDEVSGSYTGIGTRITTSIPHELTSHRTTNISGTTNYEGAGQEVLNAVTPDFDITTPFVSNDAAGTYITASLDETAVNVLARNNAELPDSQKTGEVDLSVPITVLNTGSADSFKLIGGSNWTTAQIEEFTSNTAGELTYIGLNNKAFVVLGTATVEKDGGGSATLALRIAKEDVTISTSEGATENSTPTQVSSLAVVTLAPGEKVALFVQNTGTNNDVIVNLATLLISGM